MCRYMLYILYMSFIYIYIFVYLYLYICIFIFLYLHIYICVMYSFLVFDSDDMVISKFKSVVISRLPKENYVRTRPFPYRKRKMKPSKRNIQSTLDEKHSNVSTEKHSNVFTLDEKHSNVSTLKEKNYN